MASINFSIGSTFSGEGFKQLQTAMGNTSKNVKQAAEVTNQMVSTLGMMNSKFSQAANAISGMMSAIATGNPLLIAMQAVMTGIALYQDHMQKKANALKERMDALAESVRKAHQKLVESVNAETIDRYEKLIQECKTLSSEFDKMTKQSQNFIDSMNKLDVARDIGGNLDYQIQRAIAEGEGASKVKLAQMDRDQIKKEGEQKVKQATQKIESIEYLKSRVDLERSNLIKEIERFKKLYNENQEKLDKYGNSSEEIVKKTSEVMNKILEDMKERQIKLKELREKEDQLDSEILLAKQERINVEKAATLANKKADNAVKDAENEEAKTKEEAKAKAKAEAEAKAKAEEKAQEEEYKKLTQQERAKAQAESQKKAELEEQQRRIEEQRQRDEMRKVAEYNATQQIIQGAGGSGDDGSYVDENGGLHLTSDGRNKGLWQASTFGPLKDIKDGLLNFAKKGIKGANSDVSKWINDTIDSAEFEKKHRPQDISDKEWKNMKKKLKRQGRNQAHSGPYNDLAREAAQGGGGSGGGDEEQTIKIKAPELETIADKIKIIEQKLNNLGLK